MASVVLSVLGDDRPGLVDALASVITEHRGSWERSHMSRLAGKFAGIVVVSIGDADAPGLIDGLDPIRADGLLEVTASLAGGSSMSPPQSSSQVDVHLVGADRPGIVHEIAAVLASHDVSIVELATSTTSAPMAGEPLFEASLTLSIPDAVPVAELRNSLEELANELMVDIDFDET